MSLFAFALRLDLNTQKRIAIFSLARLLLMSAVLLTTIFLRQEVLGVEAIAQIYAVLGLSYALSLITVAFWDQTLRINYFIASQLLYDLLLTSYLVYLTGINDSIFLFLYLLNIVFASVVYQLHGALFVACFSGLIYAFIYYANMDTEQTSAWYNLAYNELFFLLTALLCGQLMEELKRQKLMLDIQQENIARLELLNDRLLNSIPVGIVVLDGADYIHNINQTALSLLGLQHAPEIRLKYYELLPTLHGIIQSWERMTEKQKLRFHFHHGENTQNRFSLQVVELSRAANNEQKPSQVDELKYIIVFQNVAKMFELEKKLELESKLAATGQLAAAIAHEIRNPLASISGSIELLNKHLVIDKEEDKKLLDISLREIHRLNRLITDFLEFAKPRDGESKELALFSLVKEVAEAIQSRAGISVKPVFDIRIDPSFQVYSDPERLKQVFFNLFINSVEAAESSSLKIHVEARRDAEGMAEIDISDDGAGIPEKIGKRIFDPFFTTKQNGTGLGLATVAQIVKASKGDIALEPSNRGALFRLHLPLPESKQAEAV
jgi:two-component system sensor histidine kinase PilS (NtrC family)